MTVKPEEMSLNAHSHIKNYLGHSEQSGMTTEDLNAVLRLSQRSGISIRAMPRKEKSA
jgi:hypothetical protein